MSQAVAIYARVSSDRQAKQGTIESQIAKLREFAKDNGHPVDDDHIFSDNGVSGGSLQRPALESLRDEAAFGRIGKVLVLAPDRLARKYSHQLILVEEFRRYNVEIVFTNRQITASAEDQLLAQMQGVIAEFEREKIAERCRRGKLYKAKTGHLNILSKIPMGYVASRNDGTYQWLIHAEEAKIIRRIYDMYARERLSGQQIATRLTQEGVPTPRRAKHWQTTTVWYILKNPAYVGRAAFLKTKASAHQQKVTRLKRIGAAKKMYPARGKRPKEEWITIRSPAIVDEEIFARVQERLEENKRLSSRNNKKNNYLLTGIINCKLCGYSVVGDPAAGGILYYRCVGSLNRGGVGKKCHSRTARVDVIDLLVWDRVRLLIENPDVAFDEYMRRITANADDSTKVQQTIEHKRRAIKTHDIEKQRLLDVYQSGLLPLEELKNRIEGVRTKIRIIEQECMLIEREDEKRRLQMKVIEQFDTFRSTLTGNLEELAFEQRKSIVRLLVSSVSVDMNTREVTIEHIIPTDSSPLHSSRQDEFVHGVYL